MASFTHRAPFFNSTNTNGVKRSSWQDPRDPPAHANDKPFPHLKDLIAGAQPAFDPNVQLNEYLNQAERCIASAKTSLSFGKADIAFREYLTASEIVVNIIPRHKDYGFFEYNDQRWNQRYKNTRQGLNALQPQMEGVRKIIEDNNNRHGTQQQSTVSENAVSAPNAEQPQSRPASQTSVRSNGVDDLPQQLKIERVRSGNVPKPEHLRGPSATSNDLLQRFAELRTVPETPTSLSMPDARDFQTKQSSVNEAARPLGPREMPNGQNAPSLPPKVPIPSGALPKPPDPTYSPVNMSSGMSSTRSSQDTHRPPSERKQNYYGQPITPVSASQLKRAKEEIQPYRPKTPNGVHHAIVPKSNSSEIPHAETIDADTLSQYLKKYNVLLVDIRDRTLFDEGHIFATSILCIEPLSLKEGTSAEVLEERLVLSPDSEQNLFFNRNQFDLVVYYDQSTTDCTYLRGHPVMSKTPHLRAFYDTLYEFNEYKPLKDGRPPALLHGGLDAWVDLMGPHALATSKTAAIIGTTRQSLATSPRTAIGRQRMASTNSRFEIRDRRMRNHRFLNEKEQQAWLQQAQQEQVTIDHSVQLSDGEYVEVEEEDEPPASPFIPDYETFLRRFPNIEQQSMTLPRRPIVPPKRPEPPPLPSIPSRPPPAIPRPSYSGQAEINQTQAPLARVTSGTRQPLYSSSLALRRQKLPRTGLANFGNTCYMNATLQCLSGTIPLAEFFMDESIYRPNIQKSNWKGSGGIMPEHFANTVRALWKGDAIAIKPTSFRQFCGAVNGVWKSDSQQDSKEFFDWLVDLLHEDFNIAYNRNHLEPLTQAQEFQREKYKITDASPIEWKRFEHRDRSFVSSLFAGQHASRLKCLSCRNTSTTYEAFYSLSIEIPRSGRGDIYSCLKSYTQEEHLPPEEQIWQCPYCKRKGAYTKQIILTRMPQFLVVHFKRFSASLTEKARKIHTPINFPLHGLDMTPFVLSPAKSGPVTNGVEQPEHTAANTPPFSYDAYAVLRHLGNTVNSGHYISLVKDTGRSCWRKFDDEHNYDFDPTRVNEAEKLQNGDAYIVFFQRSSPR